MTGTPPGLIRAGACQESEGEHCEVPGEQPDLPANKLVNIRNTNKVRNK